MTSHLDPRAATEGTPSRAGHFPRGLLGYVIGFAAALLVEYLIVQGVDALFPSRAPLPSAGWLLIPGLAGLLGREIFRR